MMPANQPKPKGSRNGKLLELQHRRQAVLDYLREYGHASTRLLAETFGVPIKTMSTTLQYQKNAGEIKQTGPVRNGTWIAIAFTTISAAAVDQNIRVRQLPAVLLRTPSCKQPPQTNSATLLPTIKAA